MLQLLTPRQLGEMLGLAPQTIYNRHSTGGDLPPFLKLGNSLRFPASTVEAWLMAKIQTPAPAYPAPAMRKRGRPTKAEQIARRKVTSL